MAECTHLELRTLRDARKMARWQLANEVGVSEDTIERWETGKSTPTPEDVDRIGEVLEDPGLWDRWMFSNYDSYRKRYPRGQQYSGLIASVLGVRHSLGSVIALQDCAEKDVIDGIFDDKELQERYIAQMDEGIASLTKAKTEIEKQGNSKD